LTEIAAASSAPAATGELRASASAASENAVEGASASIRADSAAQAGVSASSAAATIPPVGPASCRTSHQVATTPSRAIATNTARTSAGEEPARPARRSSQ
jgi:hypothetical protein